MRFPIYICYGYDKMSDKKKLETLDSLIVKFGELNSHVNGFYNETINKLKTERAEVTSRIGRDLP